MECNLTQLHPVGMRVQSIGPVAGGSVCCVLCVGVGGWSVSCTFFSVLFPSPYFKNTCLRCQVCYFLTSLRWRLDVPEIRAPVKGPLSVAYAFSALAPFRVPWEAVAVHVVGSEVRAAAAA